MEIDPIRTESDYKAAMQRIEALWGANSGTAAGDELDVMVNLVEAHERQHDPIIKSA